MALLNQVGVLQSNASSIHPLFPWNSLSTGNDWNVRQQQQYAESKVKEVDTLNTAGHRINRRKVASIKHQGPIAHRNSNITVLPKFAYPILTNGSIIQIPVSTYSSLLSLTSTYCRFQYQIIESVTNSFYFLFLILFQSMVSDTVMTINQFQIDFSA